MRAALANPPGGVELQVFDPREIPFYDGDVEDAGIPAAVNALNEAMLANDGLVIFTPEYNSSYPAVTKNIIDWLSRPPKTWEGKGLTLVTTTPGGRAGAGVRDHFDKSIGHFPVKAHPSHGIGKYFDKLTDGEITDQATIDELQGFLTAFAETCAADLDG